MPSLLPLVQEESTAILYDNLSAGSTDTLRLASPPPRLEPQYTAGLALAGNQVEGGRRIWIWRTRDFYSSYSPAQIVALLWKRMLNLKRDRKLLLSSMVIPLVLLVLAMITAKIRPETR